LKWFFRQLLQKQIKMTSVAVDNKNNNNNIKTFRHEFNKDFIKQLYVFSKKHQYADRHLYKSEWTKWTQQEEISQAIEIERRRLHENGYTGDIDDKMFKAGRYYFRKKTAMTVETSVETKEQVEQEEKKHQRRPYITMSKETIQIMDEHIQSKHTASATMTFKPSTCYDDFYQTNMSSIEMTTEIEKIIEKYQKALRTEATPDQITTEIIDKIKKTYKNRYYKYVSSHKE
jgi:hypothetical protein